MQTQERSNKMRVKCVLVIMVILFAVGMLANLGYAKIDPKNAAGIWLFDEGSGDTARDSSVNKNNGTLKGGVKWVDGKFGKALEFDGKDGNVEVPDSDSLDVTAVTLAAWVKSESKQLLDGNVIVYKLASYVHQYWSTTINPGVFVGAKWCGSGWLPQAVMWDNDWHLVALTYDGSIQKFYVDGVLKGDNAACKGKIDITNNKLTIGTGNTGFYTGSIDEVAVFGVALEEDDLMIITTKGLRDIASVFSIGKLTTTWGNIKNILLSNSSI
jgi:hypothetical protein